MAKTFTQLQEAADLIKNETADGANTAERVGGTMRDIVDKMQSNEELAQTTGNSKTTAMSQDAVTKELTELDKVYITTLDITTLTNGEAVTSEQQTEVTNIFATNKPVICPTAGLYTKDTEDIWDKYILCVKEGILYAASIDGTKWFTYQYDIRNKAFSSGYVECTTLASTAEKTISVKGMSALSTGIRLLVRMSNNNAANSATLNINSLGAKALYYNGSIVSADNTWDAGAVLDVYYNGANFQAADFTGEKTTVEGGIEDVPVYQDYRRTAFFERRNGGWHVRNYYAGGDLGLIQSASDSANLNNALGPYSEFMQAVDSNVNIFTSFYTKDGKSYPGYIPIYYNKRSAENTINIYWIVESKITNIIVDISGNAWGNILEFTQVDLKTIGSGGGDIFYLNSLSSSIGGTVEKSDVESWFGSSVWSEIYKKINGKIVVDKVGLDGLSSIVPLTYAIAGDQGTGDISLYITGFVQTESLLVLITFTKGEFASGIIRHIFYIEEAPKDGKNYVRKNGEWVESGFPILSSIMAYTENNYSSHIDEILAEYDRIISDLQDGKRVLAQIYIDGPVSVSIGSDGINTISGSCTCDLYLLKDHESGSNLNRITGSVLTTTKRLTRSVYVNRVTREVQVIDENY